MASRATRPALAIVLALLAVGLPSCMEQELKPGDRDIVVEIAQLEPYGLRLPANHAQWEKLRRERWFDGSVMIEYEFDAPERLGLPYLYSLAERHPSKSDACLSFSAGNLGTQLGGVELLERNDLYRYGDKSRFGLLHSDGEPYGNYFAMCRGKTAYLVLLSGFHFDDGAAFAELLDDSLVALAAPDSR